MAVIHYGNKMIVYVQCLSCAPVLLHIVVKYLSSGWCFKINTSFPLDGTTII